MYDVSMWVFGIYCKKVAAKDMADALDMDSVIMIQRTTRGGVTIWLACLTRHSPFSFEGQLCTFVRVLSLLGR